MKSQLQLLGTALTIWKVASKRAGPVGGALATVAIVGGLVYLRPWLIEKVPALSAVVGEP